MDSKPTYIVRQPIETAKGDTLWRTIGSAWKKDKEGDKKLVYSMDVPETYGPIAHTLSFAEAAERDIICNYKVIISVVRADRQWSAASQSYSLLTWWGILLQ